MSLTDTIYNRVVVVQTHNDRRIMVLPSGEIIDIGDEKPIEAFSENDTKTLSGSDTFSDSEKLILEQFKK